MVILGSGKKLRVFVTGDSGFVGINLTRILKDKFDLLNCSANRGKRIDVLDREELIKQGKSDLIIHLASKTSIPDSFLNPYETYYTNVVGTLNILEFAREMKITNIINISTYIYGKPVYFPIDEKHPVKPHSPYTKSKLIAEKLCESYSEDYGIDIVTLRPFYIYGPYPNQHSFIASIINQIKMNQTVTLSGRNTKRDFLFIDDFIDLILKIISKFPNGYNAYNVGYGKSNSLEKVVEIIQKLLSININVEYNKDIRPNDIQNMIADISKLEKMYGWKPKTDLKNGLRKTLVDIFI